MAGAGHAQDFLLQGVSRTSPSPMGCHKKKRCVMATTTTRARKPATRKAPARPATRAATPAPRRTTTRTVRSAKPFELRTGTEDAGISRKSTYAIVSCDGDGVLLGKIYIPIGIAKQHPGTPELILRWA